MAKPVLSAEDAFEQLRTYAARISEDPQTNSVHALALHYFRELTDGGLSLGDLGALVAEIGASLQDQRAANVRAQHFPESGADQWKRLRRELEQAAKGGLTAFEESFDQLPGGVIFTAHPTFAHTLRTRQEIARAATPGAGKRKRKAERVESNKGITLEEEHREAHEAIARMRKSIARYLSLVVDVAAKSFPDDWRKLRPRLPTVATWVGYDLDGRTDIHWTQSIRFRLQEKAGQLEAYHAALDAIADKHGGGAKIAALLKRLKAAAAQAHSEFESFGGELSQPSELLKSAEALTAPNDDRVTDSREISEAVQALAEADDGDRAKLLYCLAREIELYGLGAAHIHLRVNAAQIQTVLQRDLGLSTEHREFGRVALETLSEKAVEAETVETDFADLFLEQSTARRQFILCAQILNHIDSRTPIRFLIAESENPATVMGAVYLARQYGVDEQLDISPLFETPDALENGGRFIERLLGEPAYRAYVERRGRLSIQLGFSDAGRFIGQVAANMAIERIHNLIARNLGKTAPGIDLLIFNTHGESMGRGAYPGSFQRRMDHLLTPWTLARCEGYGIQLIHEVSFQGGDGYIHFGTDELSDATVAALLRPRDPAPDILKDPFYTETNFVWDFYRSLRAWHERLFNNPDYAVLISAFAGGFLVNAGSRPQRRAGGGGGPASLRAISHNATLQQLAVPVNTAGGIGSALRSEADQLAELIDRSGRFRALIDLAIKARVMTSVPALRGYAAVYSPSFWIAASKSEEPRLSAARRRVAFHLRDHAVSLAVTKCADVVSVDLGRFDRLIAKLDSAPSVEERHALRLPIHALHAVRQAVMMFALQIAGGLPEVSTRYGYDIADVFEMIEAMNLDDAIAHLETSFPIMAVDDPEMELLRRRAARGASGRMTDYSNVHQSCIEPLREAAQIIRQTTLAVSHAYGAYG